MASNINHPEILSVEKLREILLSRSIPSKDVMNKDKNDLVQLFYRFIVPLPQRKVHRRRGGRASQVSSANMTGVCASTKAVYQSNSNETERCSNGIIRKSNFLEMDKISAPKDVSNCLHDHTSPTTDCANKITKLNVNCLVSKPHKLNRECLSQNPAKNPKISNFPTERNFALKMRQRSPKITKRSKSQSVTEDQEERPKKMFKRNTVTWP